MIHELKIRPDFFKEVLEGTKTFEIRKKDRPYTVGDYLVLNEYNEDKKEYTNRAMMAKVTYIVEDAEYCKEQYVTMAIRRCRVESEGEESRGGRVLL